MKRVLIVTLSAVLMIFLISSAHIEVGRNPEILASLDGETIADISTLPQPTNLQEAIDWLDIVLDDEFKKQMLFYHEKDRVGYSTYEEYSMSKPYGHRGIGMSIRNSFGLWSDSQLKRWFLWRGIFHPDAMSGVILDQYILHLQGKATNDYLFARVTVLIILAILASGLFHLMFWAIRRIRGDQIGYEPGT